MTKKVCKFFELLGKHTRFDRGDAKFHSYLESNLTRKHISYPRFLEEIKTIWKNFTSKEFGMNLSRFFIENGNDLLKKWYTDVFSFPKRRISFEFGQGGSQVDVLITIKYLLTEIEFKCLDEIFNKYEIENKAPTSAALIAMLEPCVLLGIALSSIIGQEIRVSIEDREIEDNLITLELSARPK